jgi:glycosyltransferase involved in cell wall biosynthesis
MNPILSIVIPTKKEESVLEKTLLHLKQISVPHEVIVSDGKSTDRTVEIAQKYADTVVLFTGTHKPTIAEGRNDGARQATGTFLAFLDADCMPLNVDAFFKQAIAHFTNDPKLTFLSARIQVMPEYENWADRASYFVVNNSLRFQNNVLKRGTSSGEFQMTRREAFEKVGGYNSALAVSEDLDLSARLSKLGHALFDPTLVVLHTGRRAHKIGWAKLWTIWIVNSLSYLLFKTPVSKEWSVIR